MANIDFWSIHACYRIKQILFTFKTFHFTFTTVHLRYNNFQIRIGPAIINSYKLITRLSMHISHSTTPRGERPRIRRVFRRERHLRPRRHTREGNRKSHTQQQTHSQNKKRNKKETHFLLEGERAAFDLQIAAESENRDTVRGVPFNTPRLVTVPGSWLVGLTAH